MIICICCNANEKIIKKSIKDFKIESLRDFKRITKIGLKCKKCNNEIKKMIESIEENEKNS